MSIKNVIILLVDALRFDCIGAEKDKRYLARYGLEGLVNTPTIDRFAENGTLFSQAISTAPDTPPAHASLFTGLYPPRHGIRSFFHRRLPVKARTIFEILSEKGFESYCIADKFMFRDFLAISRGCTHNIDHGDSDVKLFNLLEKSRSGKNFIFVRFLDIHYPYFITDSPVDDGHLDMSRQALEEVSRKFSLELPNDLGREGGADAEAHIENWNSLKGFLNGKECITEVLFPLYVRNINYFDGARLKSFIDNLGQSGLLDDSLLVITSDHGEAKIPASKVEDGTVRFDHCYANIDNMVRTPLILHAPGVIPEGKVIPGEVSIIDILPTILDVLEIEKDEGDGSYGIQGTSLLPLIRGEKDEGSIPYSEHGWWNDGTLGDAEKFKEMCYSGGRLLSYTPIYRQRSVRKFPFRYVEKGEELQPDDWEQPDEEFVRRLFRKVIADWDTKHEDEVRRLTGELGAGTVTRKELFERFMGAAKAKSRCALYDLGRDPGESVNLLLLDPEGYGSRREELKSMMDGITAVTVEEEEAVEGQGAGMDAEEIERLKQNLRNLGYL
ncbi:MAG: sulfatase-like hydrolase/transferase [Candidatus Tritonobacter lacicola]|nr:sulfatase-like hydrolase/transferase [Candidatus Tritonobacter lacicola]